MTFRRRSGEGWVCEMEDFWEKEKKVGCKKVSYEKKKANLEPLWPLLAFHFFHTKKEKKLSHNFCSSLPVHFFSSHKEKKKKLPPLHLNLYLALQVQHKNTRRHFGGREKVGMGSAELGSINTRSRCVTFSWRHTMAPLFLFGLFLPFISSFFCPFSLLSFHSSTPKSLETLNFNSSRWW